MGTTGSAQRSPWGVLSLCNIGPLLVRKQFYVSTTLMSALFRKLYAPIQAASQVARSADSQASDASGHGLGVLCIGTRQGGDRLGRCHDHSTERARTRVGWSPRSFEGDARRGGPEYHRGRREPGAPQEYETCCFASLPVSRQRRLCLAIVGGTDAKVYRALERGHTMDARCRAAGPAPGR